MNILNLSIALMLLSILGFGSLYLSKTKRRDAQWVYPVGRIMAALLGTSFVLFGFSFRVIGVPLSALLFPFFGVLGIQIFLGTLGFDFGNAQTTQVSNFTAPIEAPSAADVSLREEGDKGQFLRKWFHPIYFVLALFLGGLIGHKINMWTNFGPQDPQRPYILHSEPWMLITALSILILVIVKDRYFETRAIRALDDVTELSADHHKKLTKWIEDHLSPTIVSLDRRDDVLSKASSIIDTAISEKHDAERYVIFTGSAALYKDIDEQDSDADTPLAKYRSAMARLSNSSVHATRYISLLDPIDYGKRGETTRADYLKWIEKQITLVERNPNYSLWNCPRAPSWGSSRSSIFTAKVLLDIVGNGESGILIRGEQVAQNLAKRTRDLFEISAVVKPVIFKKAALLDYVRRLRESSEPGGPQNTPASS